MLKKTYKNDHAHTSVSLYLKVADHIRRCIEEGTLSSRVLLTESGIGAILGVSRTPARQALVCLEQENLLTKRTARGYVVGRSEVNQTARLTAEMLQLSSGIDFIHPLKQWESIYEQIENEVIKLSMLSHWRINAYALAETYACSRNVVLETLLRLESIGLVVKGARPRWTIIPLDETRLNDVFDVRSWLEPNLLAQAATNIPGDLLEEVIEKHRIALARFPNNSGAELNDLELGLHERLLRCADNKVAMAALKTSRAGLISSKHLVASKEVPLEDDDPFIGEHLSILEAIHRNNTEEGRLRLQAHLLKSREKVLNRLKLFRSAAHSNPTAFKRSWATEIAQQR